MKKALFFIASILTFVLLTQASLAQNQVAVTGDEGSVYHILSDPKDAAQARVDLIQQAKQEINALYFIAGNDRLTLRGLSLLRDAKRRGVPQVRVIIDANFNAIPKEVLAHLKNEGVIIKIFHPFTWKKPFRILDRMHDKLLLVDNARFITGGRNVENSYFGLAKKNYIDRDVFIEGSAAKSADEYFESLFESAEVEDSINLEKFSGEDLKRGEEIINQARVEIEQSELVKLNTGKNWAEGERKIPNVKFLHAPVGFKGQGGIAADLYRLIESAKEYIVIESPYFVPSKEVRELFQKKISEGVEIFVLTNSLYSTDGLLPQAGYLRHKKEIVRMGVTLHEYKGPHSLHAKSAVIDGEIALIGSYNVDPRSQNINTEVMSVAADRGKAVELLSSIAEHAENSWKIDKKGWPVGEDKLYPNVPKMKICKAVLLKMMMPLLEKQI